MKINLMVIFGGKSTEHEVSIISAIQAMENIDKEKYNIIPIYMSKNADFYYNEQGLLKDLKNYKDLRLLFSKCKNVIFVKEKNKVFIRNISNSIFEKKIDLLVDIVFPIVHGTNVEDGNLQGYFHTLNLPVVGSDCLASAISMDKYIMKEYCKSIGIPVIDAIRFDKNDYAKIDGIIKKVETEFGYPVIVKPVNLGSSIGIKKCKNKTELENSLELAFTFANIILVEKAITDMREINCAVLGDKYDCECSVLEEPFGSDEILSFTDKYMSGGKGAKGSKLQGVKSGAKSYVVGTKNGMASLKRKIPAEIEEKVAEEIKKYAKKIFKYIGCSGVARIDFIIDKSNGKIYANEINSIPGSLSYYLFEPLGMSFKMLLDKLIKISLDNFRNDSNLNFTFESNILGK